MVKDVGWTEVASILFDPSGPYNLAVNGVGSLVRAGLGIRRRRIRIVKMEKHADLEFFQDGAVQIDLR